MKTENVSEPEFQIIGGIEDNSKIFLLFLNENKTVLMMGHNIHFKGVIWKIIPKLSL